MKIQQLSTALPRNKYSTEQLIKAFPCELPQGVKENIFNLGVSERHLISQPKSPPKSEAVLSEDGMLELCCEACEEAAKKADLRMADVDYLVATYDVNPFLSPGLSQLLVPKLGLDHYVKHVNAQGIASTAFPKSLELAQNYLALHPDDSVLICVSGVSSYWFQNQVHGMKSVMEIGRIASLKNENERQMELRKWVATMEFFLFGDGVAAAVVSNRGEGFEVKKTSEVTNPGKQDYLAGYARLSTLNEPFKFGFISHLDKQIPKLGAEYTDLALKKLLGKDAEPTMKAAKKWVVHTGSQKILNTLAERQGIPSERLEESCAVLREYGNLAGASLPFILERIRSRSRLSEGDIVLMVGYGWGFSAAAAVLEWTA